MQYATAMQILQAREDLRHIHCADTLWQASKLIQQVCNGAFLDVLHHNMQLMLLLCAFNESHNVYEELESAKAEGAQIDTLNYNNTGHILVCCKPFSKSASA